MKAVRQYETSGNLVVEDIPVPVPDKGEVLIRMSASPVNFSDLSVLQGTSAVRPEYPFTPGIEGSGVVVKAGKGLVPRMRLNHRVACTTTPGRGGAWAEYMVTSATRCVPLSGRTGMEQGSMLLVNPMTAVALITIAKKGGHKAIVNNAASSNLGKMLITLCKKEKISLINIVRGKEKCMTMKHETAGYILDSENDSFADELGEISKSTGATLFLDAVGGSQTGIMARVAPEGSTILLYAKLSEEDFRIDSRIIVQGNKKIAGFDLGNWTHERGLINLLGDIRKAKKLISEGFQSKVHKKESIERINEAIALYRENMSMGKIILDISASNEHGSDVEGF